ncbi:unnamed protein product [Didymodactylos carnosus]|uniref:SCP domain-containing protein n=1 Tax=Didymodactylos carnosus TaxID=1234261 RepID=A0A8S2H007_9BILA|nr:unnamed protein product [Didymodactylos carnosus]CAF3578243.1 unnamed protein product [Didymodactylos carnosus]
MAAKNMFQHSNKMTYNGTIVGENLSYSSASPPDPMTGDSMTRPWYDKEEPMYRYDNDYQPQLTHFTQIVWKSTKEVGFGRANNVNQWYNHQNPDL